MGQGLGRRSRQATPTPPGVNRRASVRVNPGPRSGTPTCHECCSDCSDTKLPHGPTKGVSIAAAAKNVRRILMDDACYRGRLKRGSGEQPGAALDEPPA